MNEFVKRNGNSILIVTNLISLYAGYVCVYNVKHNWFLLK